MSSDRPHEQSRTSSSCCLLVADLLDEFPQPPQRRLFSEQRDDVEERGADGDSGEPEPRGVNEPGGGNLHLGGKLAQRRIEFRRTPGGDSFEFRNEPLELRRRFWPDV